MPLPYSSTHEWKQMCTRVARLEAASTILTIAAWVVGIGLVIFLAERDLSTIAWGVGFSFTLILKIVVSIWLSRLEVKRGHFEAVGQNIISDYSYELEPKLQKSDIVIHLTDDARAAFISEVSRYHAPDLDDLKRTFERQIENEVARRVLEGEINPSISNIIEVDKFDHDVIGEYTVIYDEVNYESHTFLNEGVYTYCDDGCENVPFKEKDDTYWTARLAAIQHARVTGHEVTIWIFVWPI